MNREIKFRAWDRKEKIMITTEDFITDNKFIEPLELTFKRLQKSFDLMQYTGLKDKNGKEIYEGDIISFEKGFDSVWFKRSAFFCGSIFLFSIDTEKYCIIGNIHENPELLK